MENQTEVIFNTGINLQIELHRAQYEIIMESKFIIFKMSLILDNPNNETFLKKVEIASVYGLEFVIPEEYRREIDFFIFINSCVNLLKDKRNFDKMEETYKRMIENKKKVDETAKKVEENCKLIDEILRKREVIFIEI